MPHGINRLGYLMAALVIGLALMGAALVGGQQNGEYQQTRSLLNLPSQKELKQQLLIQLTVANNSRLLHNMMNTTNKRSKCNM